MQSGETYATAAADHVEVRCGFLLDICCFVSQNLRTLCAGAIEPLEDKQRRPSLIIRTAEEGTSLWDLAKSCRTTEAAIRMANHLETDRLTEDMLLLLPVSQS